MLKKRFCLVLAIILIGVTGFAQKIPARPVPPRLVNDFANILSDKEEYALETKLVNYNDTTSTQICVVTVTSLDGTTSDDFAQKLGEKWGVGTKDNNGVVILVKPKTADELGDVSIQVGYGMEPYITDAVNYVIRTKEMIPAFKEGDYYTGIDNAVDAIIGLASGAFTAEEYADEDGDALGILVIFLAIMVVIVLISSSGKGKGGRRSSGFWNGFFLGSLFSGGGGSSWGSGGGSWGGGHGGGFGGFGGGHFGGGGGSSKW
ncbi:MAG: TPM domain-containing protein [Bacteroidales bacterium]|nr:TPM domain-containing protein [Bacteroidales bacterium]